jgi:hypothetical protein
MIYYKNKTFCGFSNCKKWDKCIKAFNENKHVKYNTWNLHMQHKGLISFFKNNPKCYDQGE